MKLIEKYIGSTEKSDNRPKKGILVFPTEATTKFDIDLASTISNQDKF